MSKFYRLASILVILGLFLAACCPINPAATPTPLATSTPVRPTAAPAPATATPVPPPAPTATPAEEPLYLAIIWHQHQPLYYKDPATGVYAKPWVRVHAAKDYLDMAAMLEKYPKVHATFNLTPSLVKQLDDVAAGTKDLYWVMAEKPAETLAEADKRFLLQRFFDIGTKIIDRFPRYRELADKRVGASEEQIAKAIQTWTAADFRDLQVLFNLAWTDPDWLAQAPLKALVDKGKGFSEDDKKIVFAEHLRLTKEVIPEHAKLQKAGQIEVTMTPYSHPILPLVFDSNLAAIAMKGASLPNRFFWPVDAITHVAKGVKLYEDHFGVKPRGMWPGEGSVAQEIVGIVGDAGLKWMASDERVLAMSLGLGSFGRDGLEVVSKPDALYKPYLVQQAGSPPVAMVFRDVLISDKVGFTYSGTQGTAAADDFVRRIRNIAKSLKEQKASGPHLVSVILDGENAWEYYANDGKEFLNSLYTKLSEATDIKTVTPSEYLAKFPATAKIDNLWAGSWIGASYETWIGESEENTAWNYLGDARNTLEKYIRGVREIDPASLEKAKELMYAAEGSDWFWWYGTDQDSGDDLAFDGMYRNTLIDLYKTLKLDPPDYLYVPIIAKRPAAAARTPAGLLTPKVDGQLQAGEWDKAGLFASPASPIANIYYTFDKNALHLLLQSNQPWSAVADFAGVYLNVPRYPYTALFSRYGQRTTVLGFPATHEVAVDLTKGTATLSRASKEGAWQAVAIPVAVGVGGQIIELTITYDGLTQGDGRASLGPLESGDNIVATAVLAKSQKDVAQAPVDGPARFTVPDLGTSQVLLTITDPKGDDHGPGPYTYPTDGVFKAGGYDILEFTVAQEAANYVFKVKLNAPVENPWNSPNGMSVQTIDIYLDTDPKSGAQMLLPMHNAAVSASDAWDYALLAEGWNPGLYKVGPDGKPVQTTETLKIVTDPAAGTVTIRVPKTALPGDPTTWGYLAVVLSQDGYGPNRVRDVNPKAEQWRGGGGPDDTNHTRIFDVAWVGTPTQEEMLSKYTPSKETEPPLSSYAVLRMVRGQLAPLLPKTGE